MTLQLGKNQMGLVKSLPERSYWSWMEVLAQEEGFGPFSLVKGHHGAVRNEPWATAPCPLPSHGESSALPLRSFGVVTAFRGSPSISAQPLQQTDSPIPGPCRGLMFLLCTTNLKKTLLGLPSYKWGM